MSRYQIKNWNDHFENDRSRKREKCSFACVPNKQHGMGFLYIMSEQDGAAIYGIWCCIIGACSQQRFRDGWLTENGDMGGRPWTAQDLAMKFRRPIQEIERALEVITSDRVGWVEDVCHRGVTVESPSSHLERKKEGKEEKGRESLQNDFSELLSEKHCLAQAAIQGIPEDFAKFVYMNWWSTGGKNANDIEVKFDRYVFKRWSQEGREWQAGTHKGRKAQEAKVSNGPSRAEVNSYAKEHGDTDAVYAQSFYRFWESKGWKKENGQSVDWPLMFTQMFAKHRSNTK